MCNQTLKNFRTMSGADRRAAVRSHLAQSHAINFAANDPHGLTVSQQSALCDMARAVSWRKSAASPLALGMAFYVYLARDAKPSAHVAPVVTIKAARRPFNYGKQVQA
jgi:hypothetical protein